MLQTKTMDAILMTKLVFWGELGFKSNLTMGGGVDKASRKSCCKKISKCIALLQHTRYQTTSKFWAIFQRSCSSISIKTTHGNTEERSASQELLVSLTETGSQLQDNEQDVVDDKWPFSSISICSKTKGDGPHGSEHQYKCDTPSNFSVCLAEGLSEVRDSQADGEEVEGIPCLLLISDFASIGSGRVNIPRQKIQRRKRAIASHSA